MPPDVPVCAEINASKGKCFFTISDKEYYVTGSEWQKLKSSSIITPPESWQQIKEFILKACAKNKNCDLDFTRSKLGE